MILMRGVFFGLFFLLFYACAKGNKAPVATQGGGGVVTSPASATSPSSLTEYTPPPVVRFLAGRDPFQSVYEQRRRKSEEILHPLQKYSLQNLKVLGVIWGVSQPRALIRTPDGNEYSVVEGTPVGTGDGKIVSILPDRVVVVERYYDYRGQLQVERYELCLEENETCPTRAKKE
jgi:type IV pilus assembly protein PilP